MTSQDVRKLPTLAQRLYKHLLIEDPQDPDTCWLWQGARTRDGYGTINTGIVTPRGTRKVISTHKLSFLIHKGNIPAGHFVMHTCDTKARPDPAFYKRCVRPEHLRSGTRTDNLHDAMAKGRIVFPRRTGEPRTKLGPERVRLVRRMLDSNLFSVQEIARRLNVSPKAIMNIRDGVSHRHLT